MDSAVELHAELRMGVADAADASGDCLLTAQPEPATSAAVEGVWAAMA
jgi:hypothetical protein